MINNPNLPDMPITAIIAGDDRAITSLTMMGIRTIAVAPCPLLPEPVCRHADMLFHYLGDNRIVVHQSQQAAIHELTELGMKVIEWNGALGEYPNDSALNSARVGNLLFCRCDITHPMLLRSIQAVDVKQGYAKCSTLILNAHAIITADIGIHQAAEANGVDALLISPGHCALPGYTYGFIGGCGGMISQDTLFIAGDITAHPDYAAIAAFVRKYGIRIVQGSYPLSDIGSIIPL